MFVVALRLVWLDEAVSLGAAEAEDRATLVRVPHAALRPGSYRGQTGSDGRHTKVMVGSNKCHMGLTNAIRGV